MDSAQKEAVWKAFWARQQAGSGSSVVSTTWDAITRAQFDAWADFAADLEQGAQVLDLATGSGKVPEMLRIARPDLRPVGIDIAEPLPPAPEGVELIGGISMETLPFESDRFDAVVSQFGFEYGDTDAVTREVLRVVKPKGKIGLMVHRGDGPILAHNRKREEQILWVTAENSLFVRILEMLPEDNSLSQEAVALAQDLADRGARRFGQGSVAWELPEAVRRTLLLGPSGSREKLVGTLELIAEQAENEMGRIQSLAEACATADERGKLLAGFESQGREPVETLSVRLPGEPPFADLIIL